MESGHVIRTDAQRTQSGLFLGEKFQGCFMSLAVHADVGDGVEPGASGIVQSGPGWQFQAVQEVLFDVTDGVFHAPLFLGLTRAAGADLETVMSGKIQVAGIELRGLAEGMTKHGCFAIIDHDFVGHAPEEGESALVAGQEVFLALA